MRPLAYLLLIAVHLSTATAEWPQFLGPDRSGNADVEVAADFPGDEPEIIWTHNVGNGFALRLGKCSDTAAECGPVHLQSLGFNTAHLMNLSFVDAASC